MAAPHSSRYPRPLKAKHSFTTAGTPVAAPGQLGPPGSKAPPCPGPRGGGSCAVPGSPSPLPPGTRRGSGQSSGGAAVAEPRTSPERRSPIISVPFMRGGDEEENPCRSNSLGSLYDPDCYMNSIWPRMQMDLEEPMSTDVEQPTSFSHKRSNSLSSADKLGTPSTRPCTGHSRKSIEGLNQEVSSALEGKTFEIYQHPDGHIAPVKELLGSSSSVGNHTPNCHLPASSHPSPPTPTTYSPPSPSSPSFPSSPPPPPPCGQTIQTDMDVHLVYTSYHGNREPQGSSLPPQGEGLSVPDSAHHPPSPKPSFAREPPDGAERCTIRHETSPPMLNIIPKGPDKTKVNIVFKGRAFLPTSGNINPLINSY